MTVRTSRRAGRSRVPPRRRLGRGPAGLAAGAIAAGLVAAAVWWWPRPAGRAAAGPLVLVSIDTLRADRLPAYGYRAVRTPAIDALAADGLVFERAYTHAPQTLPAHVSILSGLLPFQHGVRDNLGFRVAPGTRLLQRLLRDRGYASAAVVSSEVLREATGLGDGFDFYEGRMPPAPGAATVDEVQRDGAASLAIARGWMAGRTSPRFLLFLHLYEPHAPYTPPPRYAQYAPYDGEIAAADEVVGQLVAWLRERDWYEGSTILLVSDHGEGLGDHGEQEHGLFLYEEALRVPLIVKLPGQAGAGRRIAPAVQLVDLLPTILDLTGAPPVADLPGRSLRPLLEGRGAGWPERGIYAEALLGRYHFGWSELFALTDDRYRFIQAPRDELYDLRTDPQERHNLVAERGQTAAAMRAGLARLLAGAALDAPGVVPPDVRERLASLGYIGAQPAAAPGDREPARPDPKDKVQVLGAYRQALQLAGQGQLAAAADLLQGIAREEPALSDAWRRLARLRLRLGRHEAALEAYRRLLQLEPTVASGFLEVAALLLKLRRLDEARAHAELAVDIAVPQERSERAAAFEMLAKIALARPDAAAARRYAGLAHAADPAFPLPDYVEARLLYAAGRFEEAWGLFAKALEAVASRTLQMPDLYLYAGDTLAHLGRFAEAERAFRDEIRLFPHAALAYASLANLYYTLGRPAEAEAVLAVLLETLPNDEARAQAARIRAMAGRPAAAR